MRKILWLWLLLAGLAACRAKNKAPSGVLPPEKMQAVLWDLLRADQFLATYVLNKDTSLKKINESLRYYQQVFALHKISKEEFSKSFSWYRAHPAVFRALMDSIATPPKDTVPAPVEQQEAPAPVITQPVEDTATPEANPAAPVPDTVTKRRPVKKVTLD